MAVAVLAVGMLVAIAWAFYQWIRHRNLRQEFTGAVACSGCSGTVPSVVVIDPMPTHDDITPDDSVSNSGRRDVSFSSFGLGPQRTAQSEIFSLTGRRP